MLEALGAVETITGSEKSHVMGLCAGGITASCAIGHLAAKGDLDRIAGLTLGVCVLDNANAGTVGALVDRPTAASALAESQRKGYLDGRALAGRVRLAAPQRPGLELLGQQLPARQGPAGLRRPLLERRLDEPARTACTATSWSCRSPTTSCEPGERVVLDTPIDLSQITVDSYQVAGIADHITPWQSNYRSTQLLGSEPRFVLSTSGHIASLVNPPGNEKASYQVNGSNPPEAETWLREATTHKGTWWDDYVAWLGERSGPEKPARKRLGGKGFKPLDPAPGLYVLD